MRRSFLLLATPLWLLACPPGGNDGGSGGGNGGGGGSGGSGGATGFNIQTLDPQGGDKRWLAAAYDRAQNRIGVAYFVKLSTMTSNQIDYALRYVEWKNGTVSSPETIVARVNVAIGVGLAFQASGEPAAAYIGGGNEALGGRNVDRDHHHPQRHRLRVRQPGL
jgi:hypothetical protein